MNALRSLFGDRPLKIRRMGRMTIAELRAAIATGARIVVFTYTESWLVVTFKRVTDPTLVRPGESRLRIAAAPLLTSLLFGWWGIPWGPFYTVQTLWQSGRGGIDVTDDVMAILETAWADRQLEPLPAG